MLLPEVHLRPYVARLLPDQPLQGVPRPRAHSVSRLELQGGTDVVGAVAAVDHALVPELLPQAQELPALAQVARAQRAAVARARGAVVPRRDDETVACGLPPRGRYARGGAVKRRGVADDLADEASDLGPREHVGYEHGVAVGEDPHVDPPVVREADGAPRLVRDQELPELAQRRDNRVAVDAPALHLREDVVGDGHKGRRHLQPVEERQQLRGQLRKDGLAGVRDRDCLVKVHEQQRLGGLAGIRVPLGRADEGRLCRRRAPLVGSRGARHGKAILRKPLRHSEAPRDHGADVVLLGEGLEQRQHGLEEEAVVRVAPERKHRDAVAWLVEKRERRVVHKDRPPEVPPKPSDVLHARVVLAPHGGAPEQAGAEDPAVGVDGPDDGPGVVLHARREQHHLRKAREGLKELA
mmetsp:Transcript_6426/g.15476  ORF Transcript_6426/g.15476 Transcript_6426/m.15476 type:complete len:410 (-) Transcript_6426:61-1290(-)